MSIKEENIAAKPPFADIVDWIYEVAALTTPDAIYWCDGSEAEDKAMKELIVQGGAGRWLNPEKRPNSLYVLSDPRDTARVEQRTYICTDKKEDTGPTNNWEAPDVMKAKMTGLYKGCMKGRTLYVIPFCMGPLGSHISNYAIELSDSPYVVFNMRIMTRMGKEVYKYIKGVKDIVKCVHSVGYPLDGRPAVSWPCDPDNTYITHFPAERLIWSYGSGYGGNALLGKKCYSLRIASTMARDEGWLAEHMLILGVKNPKGEKVYITGALPSACGKTNLAMLIPPEVLKKDGWEVTCVGDDIAWLKPHADGNLYAINPESGFFGVAPGTSYKSNPMAMESIKKDTIFSNCALTADGDVWWEGMTDVAPEGITDWKGNPWKPGQLDKDGKPVLAAHPNARFTAPARNCPIMDSEWENPNGVKISAMLLGSRRATTLPMIVESFNWQHGTYLAATMGSEMTAAAAGGAGQVRHDPMAMVPFCGYNMGDYFAHWLKMASLIKNLPLIYQINWFRKVDGKFVWPGFGENARPLKWVAQRCAGEVGAVESPIGLLPKYEDFDLRGLDIDKNKFENEIEKVDKAEWEAEIARQADLFDLLKDTMPAELVAERDAVIARFNK